MESKKSVVIVVGAGSTFSDGLRLAQAIQPPLNKGFFEKCKGDKGVNSLLELVHSSLNSHYGVDPYKSSNDHLEEILVKVYADVLSGGGQSLQAREKLFRSLVQLLNKRMANTTNSLIPTSSSNIRRIVSQYLHHKFAPSEICLITFNYDLHIEKNLQNMDKLKMFQEHKGKIFNFPHLYELGSKIKISSPRGRNVPIPMFVNTSTPETNKILLLKLHGSLNWYSKHNQAPPSVTALYRPDRELHVTSRMNVDVEMRYVGKRPFTTYPVVIPPIIGKATVFHQRIKGIWEQARKRLSQATDVVVFGYSFPSGDYESINLLENAIARNEHCRHVSVINPDSSVVSRMGMIPEKKPVMIFSNAGDFLKHPLLKMTRT